jgi:hypothetical protein
MTTEPLNRLPKVSPDSMIVGVGNYSALIAMALVLLTFATLASAVPAWVLDRDAVNALPDVQNAQAHP